MQRNRLVLLLALLAAPGAQATVIELANGDKLSGTVVSETADKVVLDHPLVGRVELPRKDIESIVDEEGGKVAQAPEAEKEAAKPKDNGILGTGLLRDWQRNLEVGLNGATGNSNNMNLHAGLSTLREDDDIRSQFNSAYNRKEENGSVSTNNFFANYTRDWLMKESRWASFAQARYDWDQFKDWDHRLAASTGMSYRLVNKENYHLRGRVGLGGYRTWGGQDPGFTPEIPLTLIGEWAVNEKQSVAFANTFSPDLRNTGEFRNLSDLAWKLKLNDDFSVKLSLHNEYNTNPVGQDFRNDMKYNASLVWGI